jgi:hypothetical protein
MPAQALESLRPMKRNWSSFLLELAGFNAEVIGVVTSHNLTQHDLFFLSPDHRRLSTARPDLQHSRASSSWRRISTAAASPPSLGSAKALEESVSWKYEVLICGPYSSPCSGTDMRVAAAQRLRHPCSTTLERKRCGMVVTPP